MLYYKNLTNTALPAVIDLIPKEADLKMSYLNPFKINILDFTTGGEPPKLSRLPNEVEFLYILNGQTHIVCDEKSIIAKTGDIIFRNGSTQQLPMPDLYETGVFVSVIINPYMIFGLGQLELEHKYINPILNAHCMRLLPITPSDNCYNQFQPLLKELIDLSLKEPVCHEITARICVLRLWRLLLEQFTVLSPMPASSSPSRATLQDAQRVKQAVLYIQKHYTEPLSLSDIADSILVSKSECCHCFKRILNTTPFEYLMKYRITQAAARMQSRPHETISQIANSAGFNNISYFNKLFKRFMDCTPTQYKKTERQL